MNKIYQTHEEVFSFLEEIQKGKKVRCVSKKDAKAILEKLDELPNNSIKIEYRANISPKGGWSYTGSWFSAKKTENGYEVSYGRDTSRASRYYYNVVMVDKEKVDIIIQKGGIGVYLEDIKPK